MTDVLGLLTYCNYGDTRAMNDAMLKPPARPDWAALDALQHTGSGAAEWTRGLMAAVKKLAVRPCPNRRHQPKVYSIGQCPDCNVPGTIIQTRTITDELVAFRMTLAVAEAVWVELSLGGGIHQDAIEDGQAYVDCPSAEHKAAWEAWHHRTDLPSWARAHRPELSIPDAIHVVGLRIVSSAIVYALTKTCPVCEDQGWAMQPDICQCHGTGRVSK